jgi:hypothetical protein
MVFLAKPGSSLSKADADQVFEKTPSENAANKPRKIGGRRTKKTALKFGRSCGIRLIFLRKCSENRFFFPLKRLQPRISPAPPLESGSKQSSCCRENARGRCDSGGGAGESPGHGTYFRKNCGFRRCFGEKRRESPWSGRILRRFFLSFAQVQFFGGFFGTATVIEGKSPPVSVSNLAHGLPLFYLRDRFRGGYTRIRAKQAA